MSRKQDVLAQIANTKTPTELDVTISLLHKKERHAYAAAIATQVAALVKPKKVAKKSPIAKKVIVPKTTTTTTSQQGPSGEMRFFGPGP
jgi:hypothetical protein